MTPTLSSSLEQSAQLSECVPESETSQPEQAAPAESAVRRSKGVSLATTARLAVLFALAALLIGCGSPGTELRPPSEFAARDAEDSSQNVVAAGEFYEDPAGLRIGGAGFAPGEDVPLADFRADKAPVLAWWNIPPEAVELALFVLLPDTEFRTFLWATAGLSPNSTGFGGNTLDPTIRPLLRTVWLDGVPLLEPSTDWAGYPSEEVTAGERVMFLVCAVDAPLAPSLNAIEVWEICVAGESIGTAWVNARLPSHPPE